MPDIRIVDPAALPGAPDPLPKGWDAADWDVPGESDATEVILSAAVAPAPPVVELVAIDPTYPAEIVLPRAIIASEPGAGVALPAGEIGLLAGAGGACKSTLTLHMAIAAAAADDGALVSPFTGLPVVVEEGDPFTTGESQIAVCGGSVCMATWEDAAPWLAKRSRAIAKALDERSGSTRHTRVLTDAARLSSVQLGYDTPLFGIPPGSDSRTLPAPQDGWPRLWEASHKIGASLVVVDPINLAAAWPGYGPSEVGLFFGALRSQLIVTDAAALLVGHTTKSANPNSPSALDILGSGAWGHRARCVFVAVPDEPRITLSLVKANYAPPLCMAYTFKRDVLTLAAAEQVPAVQNDIEPDAIRAVLGIGPGAAMSTSAVCLALGIGKPRAGQLQAVMLDMPDVARRLTQRKSGTWEHWWKREETVKFRKYGTCFD